MISSPTNSTSIPLKAASSILDHKNRQHQQGSTLFSYN
jgi:hypothetical protein